MFPDLWKIVRVAISLSYQSDDVHQLHEAMKKYLAAVFEWLKGNKQSLNIAKAMATVISAKQKELFRKNKQIMPLFPSTVVYKWIGILIGMVISKLYHKKLVGFLKHAKFLLIHDTLKTLVSMSRTLDIAALFGETFVTEKKHFKIKQQG